MVGLSAMGGTTHLHPAAQKAFLQRLAPRSAITIGSKKVFQSSIRGRDQINISRGRKQPEASRRHRCRRQQIVTSSAERSPVTDSYDSFDTLREIEAPVDVETKFSLRKKARFYKESFLYCGNTSHCHFAFLNLKQ